MFLFKYIKLPPLVWRISLLLFFCSCSGKEENISQIQNDRKLKIKNDVAGRKPLSSKRETTVLEVKLPLHFNSREISVFSDKLLIRNLFKRWDGRITSWYEPSHFTLSFGIDKKSNLLKFDKLDFAGDILPLSNGNYAQLWGELIKAKDIDGKDHKKLWFRLLDSKYIPLCKPVLVTGNRISDRYPMSKSVWLKGKKLYVFWNGELDRSHEVNNRVVYRVFNPKKGNPLTASIILGKTIGKHVATPPMFIEEGSKGSALMLWGSSEWLMGARINDLTPVDSFKITSFSPIAYFPGDIKARHLNDGSVYVCWLSWNRNYRKIFKKQLFCRKFNKNNVPFGPPRLITTGKTIPKSHKQLNERDLELLVNDFAIEVALDGGLYVIWSLKSLSELAYYPLGIFGRKLSSKGRVEKDYRHIITVKKEKNLDNQVLGLSIKKDGKLRVYTMLWHPLNGGIIKVSDISSSILN
jgi:hypothetical protein